MTAYKVGSLKKRLPEGYNVVGQNYNYDSQSPTSIISSLKQFALTFLNSEDDQIFFVGSSLGGFIVLNVLKSINAKAVLVNPSVSPHINLKKRNNKFSKEYYNIARSLPNGNFRNVLCLVSDDDDVIDVGGLDSFNFKKVEISGGGHRMTNFDSYVDTIIGYFEKNSLLEEYGLFLD